MEEGLMNPTLIQWGSCRVTSFFVMTIVAFCAAAFLAARRARQAGLRPRQIGVLGAVTLFSMVVGSRLGYMAVYAGYYREHLSSIWKINSDGLSLAGGFLAVCLTVPFLLRRYQKPVWATIDRMILPLVLGQMIIRVGCFLQGCCYGRLTRLPWGVQYPLEAVHRHPTQLYEVSLLLFLSIFLLRIERRPRWAGTQLLWYSAFYGLFRAATDFLRVDASPVIGGLKISQWIGLPIGLFAAALLLRRCTRSS